MSSKCHQNLHYENMPIQYSAILKDNFQMKNCDIFLIFAQNINFGYTLEPPRLELPQRGSNKYTQSMF